MMRLFEIIVFWVCLSLATESDIRTMRVPRVFMFTYPLFIIFELMVKACCDNFCGMLFPVELFIYIVLQEIVFSRLYGRADCHAFCISAIYLYRGGMRFEGFIMHLFVSYILLLIGMIFTHNVGRGGKLKKEVPFLPYIYAGLLVIITSQKLFFTIK